MIEAAVYGSWNAACHKSPCSSRCDNTAMTICSEGSVFRHDSLSDLEYASSDASVEDIFTCPRFVALDH